MPSANIDVTLREADKFALNFTVKDTDGDVVDLTSTTIALYLKNIATAAMIVTAGSVTIIDAASGTCRYVLSAAETATPGKYLGYLKITDLGAQTEIKRTFNFVASIGENFE